jgi:hypothetical protein
MEGYHHNYGQTRLGLGSYMSLSDRSRLAGTVPWARVATHVPTLNGVIVGVPTQERGIRPARALPYELEVYGPNSFVRYFKGSVGSSAAALDVRSSYEIEDHGSFVWRITNIAAKNAAVRVLDAYTANRKKNCVSARRRPCGTDDWSRARIPEPRPPHEFVLYRVRFILRLAGLGGLD